MLLEQTNEILKETVWKIEIGQLITIFKRKKAQLMTALVLESLLLAVVSGGQVQVRWAGLAWHGEYQTEKRGQQMQ